MLFASHQPLFKMLKYDRWQRLVSHIQVLVLGFGTSSVTIVGQPFSKDRRVLRPATP